MFPIMAGTTMHTKIELFVVALSNSTSQPGNFTLVLEDELQQRRIPVIIGAPEAQAIAIALEKMQPPRPLTHDLLKQTIVALGATLSSILIYDIREGLFKAHLMLISTGKEPIELDARVSDAVALAVRFDAPIYIYEHLVDEASLLAETLSGEAKKGSLAAYTLPELEELLERVVAKEDYESAARIRNYIKRRQEGG